MSERGAQPAPGRRKPARPIPIVVWILIALLLAGFIVTRLQTGRRLEAQQAAAVARAPAAAHR